MNVVDDSAWLESFADGPCAEMFAKPSAAARSLIVPPRSTGEVFKRIHQQRADQDALRAVAVMEQGRVVDPERAAALAAARLSTDPGSGMLTASGSRPSGENHASLWTQDTDFEGLTGMRYRRKR
jgi:toxin FitB